MTYYPTCVGCAVDHTTCEILATLRSRLKGMSATTVKHKCASRRPTLERGMAVKLRAYLDGLTPMDDRVLDIFNGIFIEHLKNQRRCICFVAAGTQGTRGNIFVPRNGTGFVKINIRHVLPLPDKPRVDVTQCKNCQSIPSIQPCGGSELSKLSCQHVKRSSFLGGAMVLADAAWIDPETASDSWDPTNPPF